ncbi:phage associated protein [Salmonella phage Vi01]|uniref:Phage associated protein n=1 Tax=Salmonella phage ViI TaxID=1987993 RepID=E1XTJ3_BPSAV|nr:phage associated protein [Salmonella phage Vi01]CBW38052.1 phage associated protein [Salmonella phage Vi01]
MPISKLFEADTPADMPIWTGVQDGTTIEFFERGETGAEEIMHRYRARMCPRCRSPCNVLRRRPIDGIPFEAHVDPEDPTSIIITVQGSEYTSYSIEHDEETGALFIATDLQLEDDEIEYLKQNGRLPEYSDEELDSAFDEVDDEDDFWDGK